MNGMRMLILQAARSLSSARSAGSRSSSAVATAGPCAKSDSEEAAAVRMKAIRVLRTHAGLQLREGTSMHSDVRAPAMTRVTRNRMIRDRGANTARSSRMLLLAQVSGFQPSAEATRFSRTAVVQCRTSQRREPLLYVPRSFLLRTTAVQCTEPYVPYVPSREPYVPSWSQGGSAKKNVYQEQQTEYEEYAKALQGRADESEDSRDSPLAPPSLEAIEGALRAALAPVRL